MGKENSGNAVNLLCEGTTIIGDVKTKNDIRVDGNLQGTITTSGRLVVGATAKIEGNIDCENIDVQGVVVGDILATGTALLKSPGKVLGNIKAGVISIEPGVTFNGTCQMLDKNNSGRNISKED